MKTAVLVMKMMRGGVMMVARGVECGWEYHLVVLLERKGHASATRLLRSHQWAKNATYTAASVGVAEAANNSAEVGMPAAGIDDPKGYSTRTGGVMQGKADVKMVDNEVLSPIAQWRVTSAAGGASHAT